MPSIYPPAIYLEEFARMREWQAQKVQAAETGHRDACDKKNSSVSLERELEACRATEAALGRMMANRTTMASFWKDAEERYGELFVRWVAHEIGLIYERVYHRPEISLKERDRAVISLLKNLERLEINSAPGSALSHILEDVFSQIVSSHFGIERKDLYADPNKDFYQMISLHNLAEKLMGALEDLKKKKVFYDSDGQLMKVPPGIDFTERRFRTLENAIQKLQNYSRIGNPLGAFLELAFSKTSLPKIQVVGAIGAKDDVNPERQHYSFHDLMGELGREIQFLKNQKIFYSRHITLSASAQKKVLVQGYSDLVKRISGKRSDKLTAEILGLIYPEESYSYAEVTEVLRVRQNRTRH